MTRTREPGGGGGGGGGGVGAVDPPNFGPGLASPLPNFLHVRTSVIRNGLPYNVFHAGWYKVNRNFAVKS